MLTLGVIPDKDWYEKNPLVTFTDRQFKKDFRFAKADIPRLLAVLQWPPFMYTVNQVQYTAEICLLMVLYRFAYPSTLNKLEVTFGIHSSACCGIVNHGVNLISAKFENRLTEFDVELVLRNLEKYQTAITRKSNGAVTTCFGLIDATLHLISRPWAGGKRRHGLRNTNNLQRAVYSGHKRHHGLKFQSVVVPDGMIVEMFGPVEGRRHDVTVLKASKLEQKLVHLPGNAYTYRSSVPSKAMAVVTLQRAKQTSAYAGLEQENEKSAHICRTWV